MNKFNLKDTDLGDISGTNAMQEHLIEHAELFQTFLRQGVGESRGIYRQIKFPEDIREGPDVIFVPVSEDYGGQIVPILFEKIKVRYRYVDPERCFFRKTHSRIDNDHFVAIADTHTVHPEFADPAEWYDF